MRSILYYFLIGIVISVVTVSCDREKYELTDRGITATIDSIDVNIQFYSPEIVRIVKSKAGFEYEKNSLSVIKTPEVVDFDIHENEGNLIISSEKILVKLNLATAELSFSNGDETPLFTEKKNGSGFKSKLDLGTKTYAVKQSFKLDPDEKIFGLGQLQNGKMSQRYQEVKLFQYNKVTVIPYYQ